MKPNTTSLNILIDSSDSLDIGLLEPLNSLLDEFRSGEAAVSFSLCHDEYQVIYREKPIAEVGPFDLRPEGKAALYESACRMIDEVGSSLSEKPEEERPERVVVVFVTNGVERVSSPEFTKDALLARIREQSEVYRWQFRFLGISPHEFVTESSLPKEEPGDIRETKTTVFLTKKRSDVDVIAVHKPIQRTSYQFSADFRTGEGKTPEETIETAIDAIRNWTDRKLPHSTIPREKYFTGFELDVDDCGQQQLNCVSIPDDGQWCLRLIHPDNPYKDHVPITARTWTTDMSIHRATDRIRFSLRVFCISTNPNDSVEIIRPRIVPDLAEQIGFVDGRVVENGPWHVSGEHAAEELQRLLANPDRQLPVVLLLNDNRHTGIPAVAEGLFTKTDTHQSMQAFAHVVLLSPDLDLPWYGVKDHDRCEIRICYPLPREHVLTLRCDERIEETVVSIKEELMTHIATKKMDWGGGLFFNSMRSRLAELRRKAIESEVVELETVQFYEYMKEQEERHREEIDSLKNDLEESYRWIEEKENKAAEFQRKLDQKKQEYYVLYWRLKTIEEKTGTEGLSDLTPTVLVSKTAMKMLEQVRGEAKQALKRLISRVGNPVWRQIHFHSFSQTGLSVIKPGNTAERIAGFLKGDVFHVTHVYGRHEDYQEDLKGRSIKDWESVEYVAWLESADVQTVP